METVQGTIKVHARGFGFLEWRSPEGKARSAFVPAPKLRPFLHLDEVEAKVTKDRKGLAAVELQLVSRPRESLYGEVVKGRKGKLQLQPDPEVANQPRTIIDSDIDGLKPGTWVTGDLVGDGVFVRAIVPAEELELQRIRDRYLIRHPFSPEVEEDARKQKANRTTGWRDLRSMTTLTIDAPVSKDLDDALSVLEADDTGAVRVFVHIADVDSVVTRGSVVDEEARKRGTSVYLAGGVTPMLPRTLSEDRLSLNPGQDRRALTVEMRIDAEGETRSVDIYPSTIRSDTRLSYDEVDAFLKGKELDLDDAILDTLSWLRTVSGRLAAVRAARGGIEFDRYETWIELDDEQKPIGVHPRRQTPANLLIERTMVAANEAVARWLANRGLPAVFRLHPAPDARRVAELEDSLDRMGFTAGLAAPLTPRGVATLRTQFEDAGLEDVLQEVLAQILDRAHYHPQPGPHFGLGSRAYLHFTSPIRRYADLQVHRIIKAYLAGERSNGTDLDELQALTDHLDACSARSAKAEAARRRTLVARWADARLGEVFDGHVIATKPYGLIVQLGGTGATGVVPKDSLTGDWVHEGHRFVLGDDSWAIGDQLRVKIDTVDVERGRIDLAIEPRKRRKRRRRKR